MMNKLLGSTIKALANSLDLRSQKQNIISSNIANSETPGYKAKRLDFEQELSRVIESGGVNLSKTHARHINLNGEFGSIQADIYNNPNDVVREDGNTVDRDAELVALKENQLLYTAAVEMLKRKLALVKYSINEGGR